MEILQAIVLGLIQGLGEFLPISSSGHLILLPKIFHWPDQGLSFDVALHFGTLFALLAYFHEDWKRIISSSYLVRQSSRIFIDRKREFFVWKELKKDLLFMIALATVPGVIAGLFMEDYVEQYFRNPILVAFTLFGGAMLLFLADKIGKRTLAETESLRLKEVLLIGFAQAIAIVPGISRSGITITAALLLGANRALSARFSFLLATPIILGAGLKELPKLMASGWDINLITGVLTATISGYLAIKYMLKYLEKRSYNIFVIYRMILALAVFIAFI
jgi:undecaprenyl-diphosphatase